MKRLSFLDEVYEAERIVKTDDSIIGYSRQLEVFSFRGVSDFSLFILAEGQEFDEAEPTTEEKLANLEAENIINMIAMTEMFEENMRLEQENNNTMVAITELYEMLGGL